MCVEVPSSLRMGVAVIVVGRHQWLSVVCVKDLGVVIANSSVVKSLNMNKHYRLELPPF